jgi:hypothetical protein
MPRPGDQVTGLRMLYVAKCLHSTIEVGGVDVGVRKTSMLIDGVHEMGTIGFGTDAATRLEGSADDG